MSKVDSKQRKWTEVQFFLENISANVQSCANVTSTPLRTVYRWKKRLEKENVLTRKPGSGRKHKLDGSGRRVLGRIAQNNPTISNSRIANRLKDLGHPQVSRFTIGRELKNINIDRFRPLIKPLLTEKHIDERLKFCRENRDTDWTKVIFSDESSFQLYSNKQLMLGKERAIIGRPKFPPKFMVWGAISIRGTSPLKLCTRTMDSGEYILTLEQFLLPTMDTLYPDKFIFQHDNATCHCSNVTKDFLAKNAISVLKWPPNSPDLNPIENCWGLMKVKLAKKNITNLNQLKHEVELIWNDLGHDYLTSLINSMSDRIRSCLEAKGKHTDY